jgi:hypothetical protein
MFGAAGRNSLSGVRVRVLVAVVEIACHVPPEAGCSRRRIIGADMSLAIISLSHSLSDASSNLARFAFDVLKMLTRTDYFFGCLYDIWRNAIPDGFIFDHPISNRVAEWLPPQDDTARRCSSHNQRRSRKVRAKQGAS